MSDGFVNLHVHSEYSLLDGMIKVDDLVKKTLEFNQIASVITFENGEDVSLPKRSYTVSVYSKTKASILEYWISKLDKNTDVKIDKNDNLVLLLLIFFDIYTFFFSMQLKIYFNSFFNYIFMK